MVLVWLFRLPLAERLFGDAKQSHAIAWLALGVALTTYAGIQSAYINGLQRIGDLARLSIVSSIFATILGIAALHEFGSDGIVLFVLIIPISNYLVGLWFTHRLKDEKSHKITVCELREEWLRMLKLGMAVVFASAIFGLVQLTLRSLIVRDLGLASLGHFQAAWAISVTYAGLVFQAMGTDYFPRLASSNSDLVRQNNLVNEQAEVILLMAAPLFILVLSVAPWIIRFAYSSNFSESVSLLRWQVIGDILKVASWPIGFIILARGSSRAYVAAEVISSGILLLVSWGLLRQVGVVATGIAFVAMNFAYLLVVLVITHQLTGFVWRAHVRNQFFIVLAVAFFIFLLSHFHVGAAAIVGMLFSCALAIQSLKALLSKPGINGAVGKVVARAREKFGIGP